MTPTAVATPRMDPRMSRRRVAVTRARGRRRLRLVLAAMVVSALGAGTLVTLHTSLFAARHVVVRGAAQTPSALVARVSGLDAHPPLIDVNGGADAARLEALPWVGTAVVSRRWPDSVVVELHERVPVAAMARAAGGVVLVDATGRVLADVTSAPAGLPVLTGPFRVAAPGRWLAAPARPGLAAAAALASSPAGAVHGISVSAAGAVRLDLGGGVWAALGRGGDLGAELAALRSVLAGAPPKGPETIDVTVPGEPLVTPG
ncbi:MAG: cell division protein FtsQ/DivIB [Acidimicrobiales bacterium]